MAVRVGAGESEIIAEYTLSSMKAGVMVSVAGIIMTVTYIAIYEFSFKRKNK